MQVILLERVAKLGQMGEVVNVKQGFARNFLLPQGKALRASDANIKAFEGRKVQLEAQNAETKAEAQKIADRILHLHQLLGHNRQILQMDVGGMPHATFLRSIELLGTEVAPAVRRARNTPSRISSTTTTAPARR